MLIEPERHAEGWVLTELGKSEMERLNPNKDLLSE